MCDIYCYLIFGKWQSSAQTTGIMELIICLLKINDKETKGFILKLEFVFIVK